MNKVQSQAQTIYSKRPPIDLVTSSGKLLCTLINTNGAKVTPLVLLAVNAHSHHDVCESRLLWEMLIEIMYVTPGQDFALPQCHSLCCACWHGNFRYTLCQQRYPCLKRRLGFC